MHLESNLERPSDGHRVGADVNLDDDAIDNLCCQFPIAADYDGEGTKGTKFSFYL
jgi:hypothetical protein